MNVFQSCVLASLALGAVHCASADDSEPSDPVTGIEATDDTEGAQALRRRRSAPLCTPPATPRQTSEGGVICVIVPPLAPTREVGVGSPCGVVDAQGVLLSCQPGTYCLAPAEGAQATCRAAPRAPISNG